MKWAPRKGPMSWGGSEMTTLVGGRCLSMRPALCVLWFSLNSLSNIFWIFSPHTTLAWSGVQIHGSGCISLLCFGAESNGLSGIQGRNEIVSLASEDSLCSQTRPTLPWYNPWWQHTHLPLRISQWSGLWIDSKDKCSSEGTSNCHWYMLPGHGQHLQHHMANF